MTKTQRTGLVLMLFAMPEMAAQSNSWWWVVPAILFLVGQHLFTKEE